MDIAVPRDIEPEVNFMEDVYLYNIDDLQAIADDYLRLRQEEIAKCESIVDAKMRELVSPSTHRLQHREYTPIGRRGVGRSS